MFERLFQAAMAVSARLLFLASLLMLVWGFLDIAVILSNVGMTGPSLVAQAGWLPALTSVLYPAFAPPAYLLFGAALIHRLDRR